jgi:hypothetical protein
MVYQPIPQFINKNRIGRKEQPAESLTAHTLQNDPHPQYVKKMCNPNALTIASDIIAIVPSTRYYTLAGESGAADNLATINGGKDGLVIILRAVSDSVTITVKHNTGNIVLTGACDFALDSYYDTLQLIYDSTLAKWIEIGRGNNG